MPLTIGETAEQIHGALRDYIEATYHVSHPLLVAQRRALLERPGVIHQRPYLESRPRYKTGVAFSELGLPAAALEAFSSVSSATGGLTQLIHDPPYQHPAESVKKCLVDGSSLVVTTGTGSGKTECFLLPILGRLAREAKHHGDVFGATPAVRALVLYPMNALVNDQLGRLRLLFGDERLVASSRVGLVGQLDSRDTRVAPPSSDDCRRRSTRSDTRACALGRACHPGPAPRRRAVSGS